MPFLTEILHKKAEDSPSKEAIVCGNQRLDYSELYKRSNRLASYLISQNVKAGDKIGIFTNKCIEEVIAIFAAAKIGAVFVHINPQYKISQLEHLLNDCQVSVLIIDQFKKDTLKNISPEKNQVEILITTTKFEPPHEYRQFYCMENLSEETTEITTVNVQPNDLAAIIYTSGSTGFPKGVMVTHKIFEDATVSSVEVLKNNDTDCLISVTPFSFDGALSQLFTAVYAGGTLVQQKSVFPKDIVKTLIDEKITGFHAMPSLWKILLQKHSPFAKYKYPNLKYVSIIGENFPEDQLRKLVEILPETNFIMMYGTTEAFRSTYLPVEDFNKKLGSVGIPFPGVEIKIVDENDNECLPGDVGEIVHSGVFISSGYWNNKADTAKVFKNNSVYTGDLGRVDTDGYLYFEGRKDNMIKSNGFRVSPDEIEKCIHELEGISNVAVLSITDNEIGMKIKAVIVLKENCNYDDRLIKGYCRKILPFYMVPHIIEFRKNLPKTASGKINKSELC